MVNKLQVKLKNEETCKGMKTALKTDCFEVNYRKEECCCRGAGGQEPRKEKSKEKHQPRERHEDQGHGKPCSLTTVCFQRDSQC